MAQVRLLPKDTRSAVVREYARHFPEVSEFLILGDSQTYGIDLKPSESLGAHLRKSLGPDVFNMSVVDGRYSDQLKIIKILKEERKRFRVITINIDPAHFKKGLEDPEHIASTKDYSLRLSLLSTTSPGIYAPYRLIPKVGLPVVRNEASSVYKIDLYSQNTWVYPYFLEKRQTRDYYQGLDPDVAPDLAEVLHAAATISETVIAFAAPTSYEIFNSEKYNWNWDTAPVIRSALDKCRTIEKAVCLDLSKAISHEHFMDVIHLRAEGQRLLSEQLIEALPLHRRQNDHMQKTRVP